MELDQKYHDQFNLFLDIARNNLGLGLNQGIYEVSALFMLADKLKGNDPLIEGYNNPTSEVSEVLNFLKTRLGKQKLNKWVKHFGENEINGFCRKLVREILDS